VEPTGNRNLDCGPRKTLIENIQTLNKPSVAVQVNPESADEVEMDSMWSRIGGNRGESILDDKTVCFTSLPAFLLGITTSAMIIIHTAP